MAKRNLRIVGAGDEGFFSDSIVRRLAWVSTVLVLLYLVTIVSALLLGVVGGKDQYRTAVERQVGVAEASFEANPTEDTAREYIVALISARRFGAAQSVINRSIDSVDQSTGGSITAAQADLYYAQEQYEKAIESAGEAQTIAKKHYDDLVAAGGPKGVSATLPGTYWAMTLLQAACYEKLDDLDTAVTFYDAYLEEHPTAADVLVARGNLKAEQGDKAAAESDFRAALKYVADDEAALAGLEKIGAK